MRNVKCLYSHVMLLNAFVIGWQYRSSWEMCSCEETVLKIATRMCQEVQGHNCIRQISFVVSCQFTYHKLGAELCTCMCIGVATGSNE